MAEMALTRDTSQSRLLDQVPVSMPWLEGVCHGSPAIYEKYDAIFSRRLTGTGIHMVT